MLLTRRRRARLDMMLRPVLEETLAQAVRAAATEGAAACVAEA